MFRYFILNFLVSIILLASKNNSTSFTKMQKYALANLAIGAGILGWGFSQWGHGDEDFYVDSEGWFERESRNGGSDKLGHFYTNYLITRLLSDVYSDWDYSQNDDFELFDDIYMEYLELHLGYYSRNFNHNSLPLKGRERSIYVGGVGLNLSKLLSPYIGSYGKMFNYYHVPYSYVEVAKR